jgi:hypothetical protein
MSGLKKITKNLSQSALLPSFAESPSADENKRRDDRVMAVISFAVIT